MNCNMLTDIKHKAKYLTKKFFYPRRIHVFGVGAMKTGTMSISALFLPYYRSMHEPGIKYLVDLLMLKNRGQISVKEILKVLQYHDSEWYLEVESSHVIANFSEYLVKLFPNSKFILTIREPKSWLNSAINQILNYPHCSDDFDFTREMRKMYWGNNLLNRPKFEKKIEGYPLPSLQKMLEYYDKHVCYIMRVVPADRLLILRTEEIKERMPDIASFLNIDVETLSRENAHSHKSKRDYRIVNLLDQKYLDDMIDFACANVKSLYYS